MPVNHRIDESLGIVFTTYWGVVTVEEIRAARPELLGHPGFEASVGQLADCREVTELQLSADDIRSLADFVSSKGGGRRAIVVSTNLVFGMSRMYELWLAEGDGVQVFRDLAEARAWLGLDTEEIEPA